MSAFREKLLARRCPIKLEGFGEKETAVRQALEYAYELGAREALVLAADECLQAEGEHERHSKSIQAREALVMMHCYQEEDRRLADRLRARAKELADG